VGLAVMFVVRLRDDVLLLFVRGLVCLQSHFVLPKMLFRKQFNLNHWSIVNAPLKYPMSIYYYAKLHLTFNSYWRMHCQLQRENIEIQKEAITHWSYICINIDRGNYLYIIPIMLQAICARILKRMVRVLHSVHLRKRCL